MPLSRLLPISFLFVSLLKLQAQQPSKPTDESKPPSANSSAEEKNPERPAVDAAKVTGSTFDSQYFKFTCELPKDWKALDDAARVAANRSLAEEEIERAKLHAAGKKNDPHQKNAAPASSPVSSTENYSLMVAIPNGVDSLASPVLPRINIWANKKLPPLDRPADHIQFLLAGRRTRLLTSPQEVVFDGHTFMRASVITATGDYHSEYITVLGDYLVGFDFRAQSERELVVMTEMMKSIKFQ